MIKATSKTIKKITLKKQYLTRNLLLLFVVSVLANCSKTTIIRKPLKVVSAYDYLTQLENSPSLTSQSLTNTPTRAKFGSIVLVKRAPEHQLPVRALNNTILASNSESEPRTLGFSPLSLKNKDFGEVVNKNRIFFSLKARSIVVQNSENNLLVSAPVNNFTQDLAEGSYIVKLRQLNPVWHASDEYFENRGKPIPPSGAQSRFLKGALGSFAVFLKRDSLGTVKNLANSTTPDSIAIHSAKEWTKEVGGIQVSNSELEKISTNLNVGDLFFVIP
jgi:hypothetical protein